MRDFDKVVDVVGVDKVDEFDELILSLLRALSFAVIGCGDVGEIVDVGEFDEVGEFDVVGDRVDQFGDFKGFDELGKLNEVVDVDEFGEFDEVDEFGGVVYVGEVDECFSLK